MTTTLKETILKRVPTLGLGGSPSPRPSSPPAAAARRAPRAARPTPRRRPRPPAPRGPRSSPARTKLGTVLVDGRGRTLYLFEKDKGTASTCYGACASVWPPLTTGAKGDGHRPAAALLGTTAAQGRQAPRSPTRATRSTTTPATPSAGDVKGQGLDQFGAEWYVLGADGHKIDEDGS